MPEQAYFDVERGEAVVPWPANRLPLWPAYAFSAFLWAPVIIGAVASGWDPLSLFFVSFAMLFALPWLANQTYAALRAPGEPLAIGPDEMVCSTGGTNSDYVSWSDVATVAHVHSMLGGMAPIHDNLLVHKRAGGMVRFYLPRMSAEEFEQLWAVLETVSRHHDFTLLSDRTDAGERSIRKLPWF